MEQSSEGVEGSTAGEQGGAESGQEQEEHGGQEPRYMAVWAGLAVLTALEVWVAGTGLARGLLVASLVGMAVWKAALVALYYMHLKFETSGVWILALAPLPLPFILVLAVMQEF